MMVKVTFTYTILKVDFTFKSRLVYYFRESVFVFNWFLGDISTLEIE